MTRPSKQRLDRVEDALYPSETMALWLGQAKTEHRSLHALIQSYKDEPDNTWPLTVLSRQVEKAARTRLKEQSDAAGGSKRERQDLIERGEFDADRDIATLFYLFVGVNADFLSEKRALCLLVLLLLTSLRDWSRSGGELPRLDEPFDRRLQLAIEELYAWQQTVALLSERYFQRVSPLLSETEESLTWVVAQGELVVEIFNDRLEWEMEVQKQSKKRKPKLPAPIDAAVARRNAEPAAKAHVALLVDMARSQACEIMGERKRGLAYIERHL